MRLIDADKLKLHYSWWEGFDNLKEAKKDFDTIVDLQPTVTVETAHGRWEIRPMDDWGASNCRCSFCGYEDFQPMILKGVAHKYCPNCGAKMEDVEPR